MTDAGGSVVTAAFDVPGAGRTAVLADPAGAEFSVWQPDGHKGAQRVNEPAAWAMSALSTPDLDGAKAFYGSVFGWETDTFAAGDLEVDAVAPARLRGRRARAAGARRRHRDEHALRRPAAVGASTSGSTTSTRPPHARPSSAARWSPARSTCRSAGRAVLADPQGATFSISRVVPA